MRVACLLLAWVVLAAAPSGVVLAQPTTTPEQARLVFDPNVGLNPIRLRTVRDTDLHLPVNINNWWGYAAQDGNLIVFPYLEWADYEYDGLLRAMSDGKTGYLNKAGRWHIQPTFHYADRFSEAIAIVGDDKGRLTFINKAGRPITDRFFDGALRFQEGVAAVSSEGLCGFIDKAGRITIPLRYTKVRSFHDGLAAVHLKDPGTDRTAVGYINRTGKWAFTDTTGRVLDFGDFSDGLAAAHVQLDENKTAWGFIDKTFRLRIQPTFDEVRDFVGGLAAVRVGEKWGYINKTGSWQIEPTYDEAHDFVDTLSMLRIGTLWGFTDKTGNRGVDAQFEFAEPFYLRFARVQTKPNFGYIDISGRPIWDPRAAFDEGIVDTTPKSRAEVEVSDHLRGDQVLPPPPARESRGTGYPPEHLYVEVLPAPKPAP